MFEMLKEIEKMRTKLYIAWCALEKMIEEDKIEKEILDEIFDEMMELTDQIENKLKNGKQKKGDG
jgi:hypothetical protein